MTAPVQSVPEGYHTVTPFLMIDGVADAIAFYTKALGARELHRAPMPKRKDRPRRDPDRLLAHHDGGRGAGDGRPRAGGPRASAARRPACTSTSTTWTKPSPAPWKPGAKVLRETETHFYGDRVGNGASAHSGIRGISPRTSRTWRPTNSSAAYDEWVAKGSPI